MSINLYCKVNPNHSYKFIELNPELLKILKADKKDSKGNKLRFKSLDKLKSDVVLCSNDKTWLLRQKDHSNTSLLMREFVPDNTSVVLDPKSTFGLPVPMKDYLGYARTTFEYGTIPMEGQLNLDIVPIYDGESTFPDKSVNIKIKEFDELLEDSPCSKVESFKRWHNIGGCKINGYVCILSRSFISKALHVTLMSIMAETLDLDRLYLEQSYDAVNKDMDGGFSPYTIEVVKTILNKFGSRIERNKNISETEDNDEEQSIWKLDTDAIAEWYGISALKKYVSRHSLPLDEFLIKWKSMFPPFFPCDIDIDMLRGYHFKPQEKQIQYIAKDALSTDAKERFKNLFQLQSSWDLEDITPFINDLNNKNLKIDSFIMKYARRKRVPGKKSPVVTSRS